MSTLIDMDYSYRLVNGSLLGILGPAQPIERTCAVQQIAFILCKVFYDLREVIYSLREIVYVLRKIIYALREIFYSPDSSTGHPAATQRTAQILTFGEL
jgi:hypothetical protein